MIHKKQPVLFWCLLILIFSASLFGAMPVRAQNQQSASKAEQAKTLIVKIRAKNSFGTGILFSLRGGYLFIATANHVVQGNPRDLEELSVEFEFLRGVAAQAELLYSDTTFDLAVLRVDIQKSRLRDVRVEAIPFDLLGKVVNLQRGDEVYSVGHPEGEAWDVPLTPAMIKKVNYEQISFEPACLPGYSGGGLFDANWTLVAMITRTLNRSCQAISFERICGTLENDWGLVVNHEALPLIPMNPVSTTPTAPPAPSIAEQQQQHIQDLLEQAESYFTLQWYTTPAETNAFDVYRQVLQLDPGNQQAVQKIEQMRAFYKNRAAQAEQQGNPQKAIQYYQRYLKIAPNDDEVLDKLFALQAPAPQPIPTSTPTPRPTAMPIAAPTPVPKKTPRVTLRSTPITVSFDDAHQEFSLNENWQPLKYIDNDFEIQGEVVIDHATGLMWQKSGSDTSMSYAKAQEYIKNLNRQQFAAYNDWRLPTIPELMSLLEPEKSSNGLYIDQSFNNTQSWCWSADLRQIKDEGSSGSAWRVLFFSGLVGWRVFNGVSYVRAVRSRE